MKTMGALQPGLPAPTMIPQEHYVVISDLKDCFSSIPLHVDREIFEFSIPAINNNPTKCF